MKDYDKPDICPRCGSIFVDWDKYQQTYHCLVKKGCGWTSDTNLKSSKPKRSKELSKLEKLFTPSYP